VLSPRSWTRVLGLLEPFIERDQGAAGVFQFLTDVRAIEIDHLDQPGVVEGA
jgi:hypothetical protein